MQSGFCTSTHLLWQDEHNQRLMSVKEYLWAQYQLLPRGLRMAVQVRRQTELWRNAGIVFIHVPKAAGTSISLALYGAFTGHPTAADVNRFALPDVRSLPRFAVTRNPWERLVSSYRFVRRGKGAGGDHQVAVARPEQYAIAEFDSFRTFVHDWLAHQDVRKLDPVFRPQSEFVCDPAGRVLVDHVGRLDDLAPTFDFIRYRAGLELNIGQSNRSGEPVHYRQLYTPELASLVGDIYGEDVERFGYRF